MPCIFGAQGLPMCVGVVVDVWGNGIERRPPFSRPPICRPPFVCVGGAARLSRPSSAEVVGDGGRESQVEQMIIVAKEAGQWCWVIVAHFERSVSVCQSNYHNQQCIARYGKN